MSQLAYNQKSNLFLGLVVTHNHRQSPFRFPIVDHASKTDGDALLTPLLAYDYNARNGKVIGHIHNKGPFEQMRKQVQQIFAKE